MLRDAIFFPFLLVSLATVVAAGLDLSTSGEQYVLSNLFDGVDFVLTWTDLNSNNQYASSPDRPTVYMKGEGLGANLTADSLWTFEQTSNGTWHIYNGHYPNKDYRLDVTVLDNAAYPVPFFGQIQDTAGFYGQSWLVQSWSDGTAKILNPVYDLVLDIRSNVKTQPPEMLPAGGDNSLLGGQHWQVFDAHPNRTLTVTAYETLTLSPPVQTQTVSGTATSVVYVQQTVVSISLLMNKSTREFNTSASDCYATGNDNIYSSPIKLSSTIFTQYLPQYGHKNLNCQNNTASVYNIHQRGRRCHHSDAGCDVGRFDNHYDYSCADGHHKQLEFFEYGLLYGLLQRGIVNYD
ncbi:MAG: hypothetical protein M1818_007748 [Claussenomyces sp. TS43310]|nr:MAG: hypothetical protein M1818_007748 [Claussenomyces sp. TS43310]